MSLAMYRYALRTPSSRCQGPGVQNAAEVARGSDGRSHRRPGGSALAGHLARSARSPSRTTTSAPSWRWPTAGVLFGPLPCPTAGTTAPFSIAGAVAQQNAEVLASDRPGRAGPPRSADRLLWAPGHDGAAHRGFGVGWGRAGAGLGRHGAARPPLRLYRCNVYGFSTNAHSLTSRTALSAPSTPLSPPWPALMSFPASARWKPASWARFAQIVIDNEIAAQRRPSPPRLHRR